MFTQGDLINRHNGYFVWSSDAMEDNWDFPKENQCSEYSQAIEILAQLFYEQTLSLGIKFLFCLLLILINDSKHSRTAD